MSEFYAYIDESGDEGVGKGSKWFILAALITDQKQSSDLGQVYNRIIKRIELHAGKPLHWAELSHARKKRSSKNWPLTNLPFAVSQLIPSTRKSSIQNPDCKAGNYIIIHFHFWWNVLHGTATSLAPGCGYILKTRRGLNMMNCAVSLNISRTSLIRKL